MEIVNIASIYLFELFNINRLWNIISNIELSLCDWYYNIRYINL